MPPIINAFRQIGHDMNAVITHPFRWRDYHRNRRAAINAQNTGQPQNVIDQFKAAAEATVQFISDRVEATKQRINRQVEAIDNMLKNPGLFSILVALVAGTIVAASSSHNDARERALRRRTAFPQPA